MEGMGRKAAAEELMKTEVLQVVEERGRNQECASATQPELLDPQTQHPYAFHVSGPRNVPSINWRDLISSTWKDGKYKRTVIACFIQAVYLLELDRQENRSDETVLAPKWWIPFKYKLVETLIDERDGSIFGAILEWDRAAALADFVLMRPSGAPRAVLVLRGTLLKSPTIRRDIEDDLRFLAWESLKGSVRFSCAFKALKFISDKYGSTNVCIAGHSLGAGFALQVGKALAKEGVFVEAHLFNPPSVSLASSLRNMGEKAGTMWKRVMRSMLPSSSDQTLADDGGEEAKSSVTLGSKQWVPHLYVNNSDYICCYYTDPVGAEVSNSNAAAAADKENAKPPQANVACAAKLFVFSKGKQKFLEAHGLEQWWSDDLELQMAVSNSKLISRQLKSLYSVPPPQQSPSKNRLT
ncbi:alpha/beta-Hydrolases superfamily protein [Perilla frutescens var. hirtella]|uniref:Alpha/beta-Hydrolases superfamily protein n=1 Tax=Perilla frutescens var. hirtella TaxID=608512 RepID=A0AAD4IWK9_PERFH|nr:alpha/beta-Hydrolases superfamily protein [Perilla frutescens var. hirtella]